MHLNLNGKRDSSDMLSRTKKTLEELGKYNIFESSYPKRIYPIGEEAIEDALGIYWATKDGFNVSYPAKVEIDSEIRHLTLDGLRNAISIFVDSDVNDSHIKIIRECLRPLRPEFNKGTFYVGAKNSTVIAIKEPKERTTEKY